jgi:hypothetical protein
MTSPDIVSRIRTALLRLAGRLLIHTPQYRALEQKHKDLQRVLGESAATIRKQDTYIGEAQLLIAVLKARIEERKTGRKAA